MAKKKAEKLKEKMIVSSFGAWQIMRSNGYKKKWKKHLSDLGLSESNKKTIDKNEKDAAILTAASIQERLSRAKRNVNK